MTTGYRGGRTGHDTQCGATALGTRLATGNSG